MDYDLEPKETDKPSAGKNKAWEIRVTIKSKSFGDEYEHFLKESGTDAATEGLLFDLQKVLEDAFQTNFYCLDLKNEYPYSELDNMIKYETVKVG